MAIYQGEALSILRRLPMDSVDAVITDPPYSTGGMTLASRQADPASKYQSSGTKKTYPPMLGDTRDHLGDNVAFRMLAGSEGRCALAGFYRLAAITYKTDAIQAAGWMWRGIVVWHKPSARPMIGEFRRDSEFIVYASKGKPTHYTRRCFPGVIHCPVNTATKVHITGKPLALMQDLMEIVKPGGTVLDPFLGGGTTAHAAMLTGRKCIGVELSPGYAQLSADRLLNID